MHPLQAVDTGKPVARAEVTLSFAALESGQQIPQGKLPEGISVVLDLFDLPASVQCLDQAVQIHHEHPDWSAEKVAAAIQDATGQKTERWVVRSAWKLHRVMEEQGVDQPYVPITDSSKVSRWRMENRHRVRWDQSN